MLEQPIVDAIEGLRDHLQRERPWRTVTEAEAFAETVRTAYFGARTRLLEWQENLVGAARARVKARDGFSTLTSEQSNKVLRPITAAMTDTTPEAVAPSLTRLRDGFEYRLQEAEEHAIEVLDELRAEKVFVVKVDLGLKNRELASVSDIDALLAELRERLLKQLDPAAIAKGTRVRIL